MRVRTSAVSVPVSLIYAAAALSTRQPIIIALGAIMVVVAAGYLVSELLSGHGLQNRLSPSPVKQVKSAARPGMRQPELSGPALWERVFPVLFVAVTLALSVLLAVDAAMPPGG